MQFCIAFRQTGAGARIGRSLIFERYVVGLHAVDRDSDVVASITDELFGNDRVRGDVADEDGGGVGVLDVEAVAM